MKNNISHIFNIISCKILIKTPYNILSVKNDSLLLKLNDAKVLWNKQTELIMQGLMYSK